MQGNNTDWFVSNQDSIDIGAAYESNALGGHKYYVKIKSLHLLRKVRELYGDTKNLICVDFGCGTAETTEYFQDSFSHIFACDSSPGMLEYASKKNLRNTTFKLCQSDKLPFESNSIDVVAVYGVIHHIDSGKKITQIFNEIRRILKEGGMVNVYDFNPLNPISRYIVKTCKIDLGVSLDGYRKSKFPTTFYAWELASILRNAGFKVRKKEYLIFFPKIISILLPFERLLARIPLGGMYCVTGIK